MVDYYFASNYVQTLLPTVRETLVAPLSSTSGTTTSVATALGLYGPGSYITRVGLGAGVQNGTTPNLTVECVNAGGIIGTLYSALGTTAQVPGTLLGVPLTTTAWIQVRPNATLDQGQQFVVDYVREL